MAGFMAKLNCRDLDVRDKKVLVRVDYNVPMEEKDGKMVINDTTRIKETLDTLRLLTRKGRQSNIGGAFGSPERQTGIIDVAASGGG